MAAKQDKTKNGSDLVHFLIQASIRTRSPELGTIHYSHTSIASRIVNSSDVLRYISLTSFTLTVSICSTLIPLDLRCCTKSGESLSVILLPTPIINRSEWEANAWDGRHRGYQ